MKSMILNTNNYEEWLESLITYHNDVMKRRKNEDVLKELKELNKEFLLFYKSNAPINLKHEACMFWERLGMLLSAME